MVRHDEDGDRSTAARFSLSDPAHVREFIERLVDQCDVDRQILFQPLVVHLRRLHARTGAAARGIVHGRQRLPRHPRLRAGGRRRGVPLSRNLRGRPLQPAHRRDRRRRDREREPGQSAELVVAEVPDRRRATGSTSTRPTSCPTGRAWICARPNSLASSGSGIPRDAPAGSSNAASRRCTSRTPARWRPRSGPRTGRAQSNSARSSTATCATAASSATETSPATTSSPPRPKSCRRIRHCWSVETVAVADPDRGGSPHQRVARRSERLAADGSFVEEDRRTGHNYVVAVAAGESVTVEKMATIFTGRDHAISDPGDAAARLLGQLGRYADLRDGHVREWAHLWERFDIAFDDNPDAMRVVRLHLLQLLQTVPNRAVDLDAGVPARGFARRGLPRPHLLGRAVRLPGAQPAGTGNHAIAAALSLPAAARGAPRGSRGRSTPVPCSRGSRAATDVRRARSCTSIPNSGRWNPDASARAHHIGSAVAYNVWQYYQVTGDLEYLIENGAEMLAEIARFWVSRSRIRREARPLCDPRRDRPG